MKIAMRLLDAVHFRCLNARGTLFTVQKALPLFNVFVDFTNRFVWYRCRWVRAWGSRPSRRPAPRRFGSRRYEASAAFAAIVAWAHQTSSSKADFVAASRCASMSSMGLFAPIGEVDMKSAPPMLTVAAVETIRSALVIWGRC